MKYNCSTLEDVGALWNLLNLVYLRCLFALLIALAILYFSNKLDQKEVLLAWWIPLQNSMWQGSIEPGILDCSSRGFASTVGDVESIRRDKPLGFGRSWLGGVTSKRGGTYSVVFSRWHYVSCHGSPVFNGGLEEIGESIYVEVPNK